MKRQRNLFILLTMFILMALVLVACGGDEEPAEEPTEAPEEATEVEEPAEEVEEPEEAEEPVDEEMEEEMVAGGVDL